MNQLLEYHTVVGNDLAANFNCECPSKTFANTPIANIMKTRITLYGYNDDYFFNAVNKEPREVKCECGRRYSVQWMYEGVKVESK